jgi:hypothetical protein
MFQNPLTFKPMETFFKLNPSIKTIVENWEHHRAIMEQNSTIAPNWSSIVVAFESSIVKSWADGCMPLPQLESVPLVWSRP